MSEKATVQGPVDLRVQVRGDEYQVRFVYQNFFRELPPEGGIGEPAHTGRPQIVLAGTQANKSYMASIDLPEAPLKPGEVLMLSCAKELAQAGIIGPTGRAFESRRLGEALPVYDILVPHQPGRSAGLSASVAEKYGPVASPMKVPEKQRGRDQEPGE